LEEVLDIFSEVMVRKSVISLLILFSIISIGGFISQALAEEEANIPTQEAKPVKKSEEVILLERGGVLLPEGTLVVEPGFQYTHISKNLLSLSGYTLFGAIHIGRIIVKDVRRDIFIPSLTLRYGIFDHLELAIKVPWLYRRDKYNWVEEGETTEWTGSGGGLGDIEGSIHWQLVDERGGIPDIIFNLKCKSDTGRDPYEAEKKVVANDTLFEDPPTGTGHWGLGGSFTLVKAADPAVLFGSIGYYYSFERNVGEEEDIEYGKIKPGDSIEYSFGIAYALNEKLSTSISYQQRITFETKQNHKKILGSDVNVASLYLGVSYSPTPQTSVNLNVGAGLTDDAPNVDINLTVPMQFSLF
jgi:hypothetical protein